MIIGEEMLLFIVKAYVFIFIFLKKYDHYKETKIQKYDLWENTNIKKYKC
jgi:hypothetical protein